MEGSEISSGCYELRRGSIFDDCAVLDDEDPIGDGDAREPVRDDQRSALPEQPPQSGLHELLNDAMGAHGVCG